MVGLYLGGLLIAGALAFAPGRLVHHLSLWLNCVQISVRKDSDLPVWKPETILQFLLTPTCNCLGFRVT
jgi:hypothetical protein